MSAGRDDQPTARFISQPLPDDNISGLPSSRHPLLGFPTSNTHDSHETHVNRNSVPPAYPPKRHQNHTPIPAAQVFSRDSPPLFLPRLDKHLATLPEPHFTHGHPPEMFPPMERLVDVKLEDLELNRSPPPLLSSRTILGSLVSIVLGVLGSSAVASYYSLQGLMNTIQLFALILTTLLPFTNTYDRWRKVFLGTIPNVLALNLATTALESLIFLIIFTALVLLLLYYFYSRSRLTLRYKSIEGLQTIPTTNRISLIVVAFLLNVLYLPLGTMALRVIVWSQDLWIVPNPYSNSTSSPPILPPLGPPAEYRDPLDFCWTTSMKRNEINYAPAIIVLALVVIITFTVWFPVHLHQVIQQSVPKVDPYNELGKRRNRVQLDLAYHHLLNRDTTPFSFLYSGFRRGWGSYQAIYLFAKLSTLLIVTIIDPNNCLFRSLSHPLVAILRQVFLLASAVGFFLTQCFFAPFLDPINNASEWVSRLNYVLTSLLALLVAVNVPGKDVLDHYVVYIVYILTYGTSIYFTIINLGWVHRLVKRFTRRVDFSVDIFSPSLDVTASSLHTKRRIWQESLSTLFLTDPECRIPWHQQVVYAQSRDSVYPPYLLGFSGTPAERYVENLEILREVGPIAYHKAAALINGPDAELYSRVEDTIQSNYVGPDSYWKDPAGPSASASCFGNAWFIPFPPTVVIRFDEGPLAILRDLAEFEAYISQNSSRKVQRKRQLRMALRCLDGHRVLWPYDHVQHVGSQSLWCGQKDRYVMESVSHYDTATLGIFRQGELSWGDLPLGSGFHVELSYASKVKVDGGIIGLNDDFEPTSTLLEFLELNRDQIVQRLGRIEAQIAAYRENLRNDCLHKKTVLSYKFLSTVYENPQTPDTFLTTCGGLERDVRVNRLFQNNVAGISAAYERFVFVSLSEPATWWYMFWDDLWRRNHSTISAMQTHATDFNPFYSTSIAYRPLPRPALEVFLSQRGMFSKTGGQGQLFHSGLLNKIYLRLNDTVFHKSEGAVLFHLGYGGSELTMDSLDAEEMVYASGIGTGGGTDHDDSTIARPLYRWEGLLEDPLPKGKRKRRRFFSKLGAWLGITPLWQSEMASQGISLDVRLENGRYILLDNT